MLKTIYGYFPFLGSETLMREFTVFLVLFALVGAFVLPARGQQPVCFYKDKNYKVRRQVSRSAAPDRDEASSPASRPTADLRARRRIAPKTDYADFSQVQASPAPGGKGNVVAWEMAEEKGDLGFYVKRVGQNGVELVQENLTVGAVAVAANQPIYGQTYRVYDPKGLPSSTYIIETLGPQGERMQTEEIAVGPDQTQGAASMTSVEIARETNSGIFESIAPTAARPARATSDVARGAYADPTDISVHRWVVDQPGAKISVRSEGIFRVRLAELQSAAPGVFNAGNTSTWRLFREGVEQAILVNQDANGPYIEFYGRPIDTRESDTRVYYLISDAVTPGKRMTVRALAASGGTQQTSYSATSTRKERTTFIGTIINGEPENWWGRAVTSAGTTLPVVTTGVDFSKPEVTVTLKMQGLSLTPTPPRISLKVNGTLIGEVSAPFSQMAFGGQFNIPTSLLAEGSNAITLASVPTNNAELFDSFSITYARSFTADPSGRLKFTLTGDQWGTVRGFKSEKVRAFDLRDPDSPVTTDYLPVARTHDIRWSSGPDPSSVTSYIVADRGILSPASVTGNTPSHLASTVQPADLIIISYGDPSYMAVANTWANYRRNQGFQVAVVDVTDILDEYSFGSTSSKAVKDFLQYAHTNWPTALPDKQYVLLLGDACTDSRNYYGLGYWNQVPTMMVQTIYSETGSDDALADFDGDGLAEMSIGRIPFRTAAWLNTAYNKTVQFESNPNMQSLDRGTLFAFDKPNGYDFYSMSQDLASQLPAATNKTYVGLGLNNTLTPDPDAHTNLMAALNAGKFLVNYSGHGAQSIWSTGSFLNNTAVNTELANGTNYSIYTMLTCLNGYFVGYNGVDDPSIAELFLRTPNGGGPAAWASTGLTTADVQMLMGREFMSHLGAGDIPRIGDLIREAKGVIPAGADVRFSWALLGDPMLKVR